MSSIYTMTVPVQDTSVGSTFVVSGGKVTSKTTGQTSINVTVPAIPVGASITLVTLTVTTNSPIGWAELLTVEGVGLATSTTQDVIIHSITAPGTYSLTYRFRSSGQASMSEGTHVSSCTFKGQYLTVEYISGDPVPVPEEDPTPDTVLVTDGEIVLYSGWADAIGGTYGLGKLSPSECTVTQEAGGEYSLSLTHPLTPDGIWKNIVPFCIIRVPVPAEDTPFIDAEGDIVTEGLEIWRIKDGGGGWYTSTASTIRTAWQTFTYYAAGSYCRHAGTNYQCLTAHTSTTEWADTASLWKSQGSGAPRPARTLPEWTRLYVSSSTGSTWLYCKLSTGQTGYVLKSEAVYIRTATEQDVEELSTEERHITDQPFRITDVSIDGQSLRARGQHVSYDCNFWLLRDIQIVDEALGDAILDIRASLIGEEPGEDGREPFRIFAQSASRPISATYSNKSPSSAILDPDFGLVPLSRSRLVRDNWDFFLISNEETDRGFRLQYGINLTGVSWQRDFSGLITRIMPVAKDSSGNPFYLPEVFVDSPVINAYPVRAYEVLQVDAQIGGQKPDESGTWTEAEVIAEMRSEAADRFLVDRVDQPTVNLSVEFALLGHAAGYERYRGLERVSLYDTVRVDHPDIGLSTTIQVKGYEWDAIRQRFNRLTLGDVFEHGTRSIPGYEIGDGAITLQKIDAAALAQLRGG